MTIKDTYLKEVNNLIKEPYIYVCIKPIRGLKSLNQFRFLIKKMFRDVSKIYGVYEPHLQLKYVSVIEMNKSIIQGDELFMGKFSKSIKFYSRTGNVSTHYLDIVDNIDELGFHTHIFLQKRCNNTEISNTLLKQHITNCFNKVGIEVNYYNKVDEVYSINNFINYHTKQLHYLNSDFVIYNTTQ
jgi:hypothetical protein